jgi:hypothetical protein
MPPHLSLARDPRIQSLVKLHLLEKQHGSSKIRVVSISKTDQAVDETRLKYVPSETLEELRGRLRHDLTTKN